MNDRDERRSTAITLSEIRGWIPALVMVGAVILGYGKNSTSADLARVQIEALQSQVSHQVDTIGALTERVAKLEAKIETLTGTIEQSERFQRSVNGK